MDGKFGFLPRLWLGIKLPEDISQIRATCVSSSKPAPIGVTKQEIIPDTEIINRKNLSGVILIDDRVHQVSGQIR